MRLLFLRVRVLVLSLGNRQGLKRGQVHLRCKRPLQSNALQDAEKLVRDSGRGQPLRLKGHEQALLNRDVITIRGLTCGTGPRRIRSSKLGLSIISQHMKAPNLRESTTGESSRAVKSVSEYVK